MKNLFLKTSKLLMNFIMMFTLIYAPVVFDISSMNSSVVYADDPCTDDIETRDEQRFKVGCDFNENLAGMKSIDSKYLDILVYTLLMFQVVSIGSIKESVRSLNDAPSSLASYIPRAAQGVVLSAVISEIVNNSRFRDTMAGDINTGFAGKKTDDDLANNKQLEAYEQVKNIYELQADIAETKRNWAIFLTAGLGAVELSEIGNTGSQNSKCTTTRSTQAGAFKLIMDNHEKALLSQESNFTQFKSAVAAEPMGGALVTTCGPVIKSLHSVDYLTHQVRVEAKGKALLGKIEAAEAIDRKLILKEFKGLFSAKAAASYAESAKIVDKAKDFGKFSVEKGLELKAMGVNEGIAQVSRGIDLRAAAAATSFKLCSEELMIGLDSCIFPATYEINPLTCTELTVLAPSAALAAGVFTKNAKAVTVALDTPILGCGSDGANPSPNYRIPIPTVSSFSSRIDLHVTSILDSFSSTESQPKLKDIIRRTVDGLGNEKFDEKTFFKTDKMRKYAELTVDEVFEKMLFNILYQISIEKVMKKNHKDKVAELREHKKNYQMLTKLINEKHYKNTLTPAQIAKFKNKFKTLESAKDLSTVSQYFNELQKTIRSSLVPDAHAILSEEGSGWIDLLVTGGAVWMLSSWLGDFIRNSVLRKPSRRYWFWPVYIALGGLMINKHANLAEKASTRATIAQKELNRFDKAIKSGTEFNTADGQVGSGDTTKLKSQVVTSKSQTVCAGTGAQGSFVPAKCPSKIAPRAFQLPRKFTRQKNGLTPVALDAFSSIASVTSKVASTGQLPSASEQASLSADLSRKSAAIRKQAKRLREKLSKVEARGKDSKSKGLEDLINETIAAFKGDTNFSPSSGPIGGSIATSSDGASSSKESKDVAKIAAIKVPSIGNGQNGQSPTGFGDFGDLGDLEDESTPSNTTSSKKEKSLEDFKIDHDDINKKKEVSLFKILSNRYILSYPKIVPEKKKKAAKKIETKAKTIEEKLDSL